MGDKKLERSFAAAKHPPHQPTPSRTLEKKMGDTGPELNGENAANHGAKSIEGLSVVASVVALRRAPEQLESEIRGWLRQCR